MREEIETYIHRAFVFLRDAEFDFSNGEFDIAMFHIEQACQLLLKAKLLEIKGSFPKTHDIEKLLREIYSETKDDKIKDLLERRQKVIRNLVRASRYYWEKFFEDEVKEAFDFFREVEREVMESGVKMQKLVESINGKNERMRIQKMKNMQKSVNEREKTEINPERIFSYSFRKYFFQNWRELAKRVKVFLEDFLDDFDVYVFGSIVEGNWCVGISDIDIAVVSSSFEDRKFAADTFNILQDEFFRTPFEFHVLPPEKWNFLKKLAGRFVKV